MVFGIMNVLVLMFRSSGGFTAYVKQLMIFHVMEKCRLLYHKPITSYCAIPSNPFPFPTINHGPALRWNLNTISLPS